MGLRPYQPFNNGYIDNLNWLEARKGPFVRGPMLDANINAAETPDLQTVYIQDGTTSISDGGNISLILPYLVDVWRTVNRHQGRRENVFAGSIFGPDQVLWAASPQIESVVLDLQEYPDNISEDFGDSPIIYAGKFQFMYEDCMGPLHFINAPRMRVWPESFGCTGINIVPKPDVVVSVYTSSTGVSESAGVYINGTPSSPMDGIMQSPVSGIWY